MTRKRTVSALIGGSVAAVGLSLPAAVAAFDFTTDYAAIDSALASNTLGSNYDYTVSFHEGSSSSSDSDAPAILPKTVGVVKGEKLTPEMIDTTPSKTGYTFAGYYCEESCTNTYTFYDEIDSNITLYVKFVPYNSYTYKNSNSETKTLDGSFNLEEDTETDSTDSSLHVFKFQKEENNSTSVNAGVKSTDGNYRLKLENTSLTTPGTYSLQVYGLPNDPTFKFQNSGYAADCYKVGADTSKVFDPTAKLFTLVLENDLTIGDGVTLDLGGTSPVFNNGFYGGLNGDSFALDLNGHNLTVEKGGTFNVYGFLTDSTHKGMVQVEDGGTIQLKMTTLTLGGNTLLQKVIYKDVLFDYYGFPMVDADVRVYAGGRMYGQVAAGTSQGTGTSAVFSFEFLGPESSDESTAPLIAMEARDSSKPAYMDFRHNMIPKAMTVDGTSLNVRDVWDLYYREYFTFNNCRMTLGSLVAGLGDIAQIDSATQLWYLPGNCDIKLVGSDLTILGQFQLMPGFNFFSDQDSNIILAKAEEEEEKPSLPDAGEDADTEGENQEGDESGDFDDETPSGAQNTGIVSCGRMYTSLKAVSHNQNISHNMEYVCQKPQAQITVMGGMSFDGTSADNTFLGGYFNLSDRALNAVIEAARDNKVNLLARGEFTYLYYEGFSGTKLYPMAFFVYPFINNGTAYTNDNLTGNLKVYQSPSTLIYTDGTDFYTYFDEDVSVHEYLGGGTFKLEKINIDSSETRGLTFFKADDTDQKTRYLNFAGIAVQAEYEQSDDRYAVHNSVFVPSSEPKANHFVAEYDQDLKAWVRSENQVISFSDVSYTITLKPGENCNGAETTISNIAYGTTLQSILDSNTGFTANESGDSSKLTAMITFGDERSIEIDDTSTKLDIDLDEAFSQSGSFSITINYGTNDGGDGDSCIFADTPILMADLTYRRADQIRVGDRIMAYNFETGRITPSTVCFTFFHGMKEIDIFALHIYLENGDILKFAVNEKMGESFFDPEKKEYFELKENNYSQMVGRAVATFQGVEKRLGVTRIKAIEGRRESQVVGDIITTHTMNFFATTALTANAIIANKVYFEIDDDLKYAPEKKKQDIEKYGLFTYEDFKDFLSEEVFDSFNCQYFKVAYGKGVFTPEYIKENADRFGLSKK